MILKKIHELLKVSTILVWIRVSNVAVGLISSRRPRKSFVTWHFISIHGCSCLSQLAGVLIKTDLSRPQAV
jgi:hypothetical protein